MVIFTIIVLVRIAVIGNGGTREGVARISFFNSVIPAFCNFEKFVREFSQNSIENLLNILCNLQENITRNGVNSEGNNGNTFQDRFWKHRNSFKYESKANTIELPKHFCDGTKNRSSHQRCSVKGVLKIFAKFPGKHLCWSLFFNEVTGQDLLPH